MKKLATMVCLILGWDTLAEAQTNFVISGLRPNGTLCLDSVPTNALCTVEWAPTVNGPWTNTWTNLVERSTGTNTSITFQVPMFYRVRLWVPEPIWTVEWCDLHYPVSAASAVGVPFLAFTWVRVPGLTSRTDGVDSSANFLAQIGYCHASQSDPGLASSWTWVTASPSPGWNASAAGAPGADEYYASVTAVAPGNYYLGSRYSGDKGTNWVYGNLSGGPYSDVGFIQVNPGCVRVN